MMKELSAATSRGWAVPARAPPCEDRQDRQKTTADETSRGHGASVPEVPSVPPEWPAHNRRAADEESFRVPPAPPLSQSAAAWRARTARAKRARRGAARRAVPAKRRRPGDRGREVAPAGRRRSRPAERATGRSPASGRLPPPSRQGRATAAATFGRHGPPRAARWSGASRPPCHRRCRSGTSARIHRTTRLCRRSARRARLCRCAIIRAPGRAERAEPAAPASARPGREPCPKRRNPLLDHVAGDFAQLLSMETSVAPSIWRSLIRQQLEQVPVP